MPSSRRKISNVQANERSSAAQSSSSQAAHETGQSKGSRGSVRGSLPSVVGAFGLPGASCLDSGAGDPPTGFAEVDVVGSKEAEELIWAQDYLKLTQGGREDEPDAPLSATVRSHWETLVLSAIEREDASVNDYKRMVRKVVERLNPYIGLIDTVLMRTRRWEEADQLSQHVLALYGRDFAPDPRALQQPLGHHHRYAGAGQTPTAENRLARRRPRNEATKSGSVSAGGSAAGAASFLHSGGLAGGHPFAGGQHVTTQPPWQVCMDGNTGGGGGAWRGPAFPRGIHVAPPNQQNSNHLYSQGPWNEWQDTSL